ncbi:MAG: polysaccharide deacetylase family protein [Proteobacteria bacterium]|nr:polysaccharide deacetylase family protein [Pseudomonadota bacterium]
MIGALAARLLAPLYAVRPIPRRDLVICLHGVIAERRPGFAPELDQRLSPADFRALVGMLRRSHDIVPLAGLLEARADGRPRAALTFDDGYRDNLAVVLPLLAELDATAAVFITTGYVETGRTFWWDALGPWLAQASGVIEVAGLGRFAVGTDAGRRALYRRFSRVYLEHQPEAVAALLVEVGRALRAPPAAPSAVLSAEELRALAASGRVEIGSHLVEHAPPVRLGRAELENQLVRSCRALESWTGAPVRLLAWPNGQPADIPPEGPAMARAAGYAMALTTSAGFAAPAGARPADPFAVPRISITRGLGGAMLRARLAGLDVALDRLRRLVRP